MKRCLLLSVASVLAISVYAVDYLFVREKTGDTQIAISDIESITFPDGKVVITKVDGNSYDVADDKIYSLRFNGNSSEICVLPLDDKKEITYDGTTVAVANGGRITVCTIDGRVIATSENGAVDVSELNNGVYIVTSDSVTTKIVKK